MTATSASAQEAQRGSRATQPWDPYSDTWAATDALGRAVPAQAEVGLPRPDRWVGIFYFLWLGAHINGGPWDITRILQQDPDAMEKPESPLWGPMYAPHHWGESIFGYYLNDDKYVLRKHTSMLAAAGVDTLLFDTSNKVIYEPYYTALFEVLTEARAQGNPTPYVAFLTPFWDPASTVQELYDKLYAPGLFEDLWFKWDGKPLILANPEQVNPALRDFFTFRRPQPSYFTGPQDFSGPGYEAKGTEQANMWAWLEIHPQHVFRNDRGEREQMSVGVAQNAVPDPNAPPVGEHTGVRLGTLSEPGAYGRSYHKGADFDDPEATLQGHNFAEQWERALKEDPLFVFVTGWNEWYGGRFDEFNGARRPVMFVDTFNQEHSRDIEPMKGGYSDNYYYQLASYIRRYKGARPLPLASPALSIDLAGPFAQWGAVAPEYRDFVGDTVHRDHPGYNTVTRYRNTTGRNDIIAAKVARDAEHCYFYVKTQAPLSPYTDPDWMVLFLNADCDATTGWHGYDFVVNRRMREEGVSVIEHTTRGWLWQPKGQARFRCEGNELMLAIPRELLGLTTGPDLEIEFKWADNFAAEDDLGAFLLNGDAAPLGRFNYRYTSAGPAAGN